MCPAICRRLGLTTSTDRRISRVEVAERKLQCVTRMTVATPALPAMGGGWPGRPRWRLRTDLLVVSATPTRRGATAVCGR